MSPRFRHGRRHLRQIVRNSESRLLSKQIIKRRFGTCDYIIAAGRIGSKLGLEVIAEIGFVLLAYLLDRGFLAMIRV